MCKLKITCSSEDKQWLRAAIKNYCKEIAGTPPWADGADRVDDDYYDDILSDIVWDVFEEELRPARCPECSGDFVTMMAEYNEFPSEARGFYIECKTCGARTGFHRKREGAIKSWNRRAKRAIAGE